MKKNGSWKKKILYSVTAAVLFVLLLVLFFPGDREYQRIPYDVVFLGDSVYGLCRDETSIAAKLQDLFPGGIRFQKSMIKEFLKFNWLFHVHDILSV